MPSLPGRKTLGNAAALGRGLDRQARRAVAVPARWAVLRTVDVTVSAVDSAVTSQLAADVVQRLRSSTLADTLQPLLLAAVESPEAEKLIAQVIDSRVVEVATEQLLEADALWDLVDTVAQSPAVAEAINRQGLTFADQMVGVARDRSRKADDRLERFARRLTLRSAPDADGAPRLTDPLAGDRPVTDPLPVQPPTGD